MPGDPNPRFRTNEMVGGAPIFVCNFWVLGIEVLAKHLVIGGSGFIGSNLVARLLSRGERVTVFDNLSRHGVDVNLQWLQTLDSGSQLTFCLGDIRDAEAVSAVAQ